MSEEGGVGLSCRVGAGTGGVVIASAINVAAVKALVKTMAGLAWWRGSAWRWWCATSALVQQIRTHPNLLSPTPFW